MQHKNSSLKFSSLCVSPRKPGGSEFPHILPLIREGLRDGSLSGMLFKKYLTVILISFLSILIIQSNIQAQNLDIFGYFEPQYFCFSQKDVFYQTQSNKLRIDLQSYPTDRIEFGANLNLMKYAGKKEYSLLDYLSPELLTDLTEEDKENYTFAFRDTILLDNVYLKMAFEKFDLTIGRQQITYGSGFAWNPTFIYNDKDILDPTYEKPGHNAIRLDVPFSYSTNFMAFYSPGKELDHSICLGRLKTNIDRFDLALCVGYLGNQTTLLNSDTELDEYEYIQENRKLYGLDFVGEVLGMGVWFEGAWNSASETDDYYELLGGIDYTMNNGTYLMCEYYYNDLGLTDLQDYTLMDWLQYFSGEYRSLVKNNIFTYIDYPATDLVRLGLSSIVSLNDESAALVPQLTYSIFQDVELILMGNLYIGKTGAMFNKDLGAGGILRLKCFF